MLRESGHVAVKKLHRGYTSQACIEMTKLLGAMSSSDRAGSKWQNSSIGLSRSCNTPQSSMDGCIAVATSSRGCWFSKIDLIVPLFRCCKETRNWRTWITVLCVLLLAWCIRDQYLLSSASSLLPRPPLANSCRTSAIKNLVSGFLGPPPVTRPLGTVSILGLLHGLSLSPKARYLCMSLLALLHTCLQIPMWRQFKFVCWMLCAVRKCYPIIDDIINLEPHGNN